MQLDDTKHKVYIYDLDAELSSSDTESESPDDAHARLVFLPDIERHLRAHRIPPSVLANRDGELAGHCAEDMQLVLYREPAALSVPEERDGVRRAVIEARRRLRERQLRGDVGDDDAGPSSQPQPQPQSPHRAVDVDVDADVMVDDLPAAVDVAADDPDAMEMD